ncbi:hypothetical protein ACWC09_43170 [Streptomyces sp. NPDC001617]
MRGRQRRPSWTRGTGAEAGGTVGGADEGIAAEEKGWTAYQEDWVR